jgi:protease-4
MAADEIVANPGTITGSIGGDGKLISRELKDKLASARMRCAPTPCRRLVAKRRSPPTARAGGGRADLFYTDLRRRGPGPQHDDRGRRRGGRAGCDGADAKERGLSTPSAVCTPRSNGQERAGIDADQQVRVLNYPVSRCWTCAPKPSSQPVAPRCEALAARSASVAVRWNRPTVADRHAAAVAGGVPF